MENTSPIIGPRKTLLSVLAEKIIAEIERHSLRSLLTFLGLSFLAGLAARAVIDFDGTAALLVGLLKYHDFAPLKVAGTFALVFNGKRIVRSIHAWLLSIIELLSGETVVETLEGIPTTELLDHLFTEKSFKRNDVEEKFGIPRYKVTELTKRLKEIEVLIPGENNASVLNPEYSRQDVASILRGARTAADLKPLFRRRDDSFTFEPSASEIEERVNALLSPAPNFQKREILETA